MPKAKIRSTIKKRFRVTKTGKILHKRGAVSHRTSKERSKTKTRRRRKQTLAKVEVKRVKRMLGVG